MRAHRRAATLPVSFFDRPADVVARELLGALVVSRLGRRITSGRIVETEAYLGYRDPASHGYLHRRNDRNAALFGPPGSWYVYLSYGIHWCANLVCEAEGTASAVLLRGLEPVEGIEVMRGRRGRSEDRDLCSGPGRLCQALGITRGGLDGRMMPDSSVVVRPAGVAPPFEVDHHAADRNHQGRRLAAPVPGSRQSSRLGPAGAFIDRRGVIVRRTRKNTEGDKRRRAARVALPVVRCLGTACAYLYPPLFTASRAPPRSKRRPAVKVCVPSTVSRPNSRSSSPPPSLVTTWSICGLVVI